MLLRFSNFVTLSLILAEHMANAHGDHDHDHEHHHGHSHVHHDAPRRLGIFGNPSNRPCKDGEETFVVGGVTYECREDFNEKGGQCRSPDRTPEEKAKAKNDFKAWKEEKSKKVKRQGGERRLAEGCGDCVDWDTQVITIPTYFHVIHSGTTGRKYTYEGYSDSNPDYIQNQVKALNLGFRGDVSEFPPNKNGRSYDRFDINAADTKIQFCLMGTTASNDSTWYADKGSTHLSYKRALDVGGMETLNIYANTASGYLGYAYFPTNSDSDYDGVVILNDSMPGGPTGIYSEGDTLTHEVGHWLGLEHTHQGGCSGPGDYMDEAPPGDGYGTTKATESTATFNCPVGLDNCSADGGKKNPIHNFMSYSEVRIHLLFHFCLILFRDI